MKPLNKLLYDIVAYTAIGLGVLGIFLPLLPTTPFLLLAVWCLSRSNPQVAQKLCDNRFLGIYIRSYTKHEKLPLRDKIRMILLCWILLLLSAVFLTENLYIRFVMGVVAIAVAAHVLMLRTKSGLPPKVTALPSDQTINPTIKDR